MTCSLSVLTFFFSISSVLRRTELSLEEVQCYLQKEGATDLVINLIIGNYSEKIFHESILLGIALLEEGNHHNQVEENGKYPVCCNNIKINNLQWLFCQFGFNETMKKLWNTPVIAFFLLLFIFAYVLDSFWGMNISSCGLIALKEQESFHRFY